jgi:hypothetical protein
MMIAFFLMRKEGDFWQTQFSSLLEDESIDYTSEDNQLVRELQCGRHTVELTLLIYKQLVAKRGYVMTEKDLDRVYYFMSLNQDKGVPAAATAGVVEDPIKTTFEREFKKDFNTVVSYFAKKGRRVDCYKHYFLDDDDNEYIYDPRLEKWSYNPSHSEAFLSALFSKIG